MTVRFPISGEIGGDLVGMALAELRLCKVDRKETVVLFTDTRTNPNYVAAFLAAGKELAGSIFEVKVPFLPEAEGKSINLAPVLTVLKSADFVIDLSTGSTLYIYGEGLGAVLAGGTRVLQVKANEDQLRRCFPTDDVRQRTIKGARWLDGATEIRLASKAGSDLTMRKRGRPALTQLGISDEKGRWGSRPSGFLLLRAGRRICERHVGSRRRRFDGHARPLRHRTGAHRSRQRRDQTHRRRRGRGLVTRPHGASAGP